MAMQETIFEYIRENEPVDQDTVENEFGRRGLDVTRRLMESGKISYDINWDLQTEVDDV